MPNYFMLYQIGCILKLMFVMFRPLLALFKSNLLWSALKKLLAFLHDENFVCAVYFRVLALWPAGFLIFYLWAYMLVFASIYVRDWRTREYSKTSDIINERWDSMYPRELLRHIQSCKQKSYVVWYGHHFLIVWHFHPALQPQRRLQRLLCNTTRSDSHPT